MEWLQGIALLYGFGGGEALHFAPWRYPNAPGAKTELICVNQVISEQSDRKMAQLGTTSIKIKAMRRIGTVRAASLTQFRALAQAYGLDDVRLLASVGLNEAMLRNPDQRISTLAVSALLELAAATSGVQSFGLQLGFRRHPADLGAVSLLVNHQPTLRDALSAILQYQHLTTHSVTIQIEDAGPLALIHANAVQSGPARQANEMLVGMIFCRATEVLSTHWAPVEVRFTHGPPPDARQHRELLRCPVQFDAAFNGIVCRAEDLDRPNPHADASMEHYARQFMESLPVASGGSLVQEVRKAIYMLLPTGHATGEQVALGLGMSLRSLQRRIGESGTSFQQLLDEVRKDLTLRYMESADRPLGDIAAQVGFRSPSAFSRWFSLHFGMSAAHYRLAEMNGLTSK